jgi:hypothetical protein
MISNFYYIFQNKNEMHHKHTNIYIQLKAIAVC